MSRLFFKSPKGSISSHIRRIFSALLFTTLFLLVVIQSAGAVSPSPSPSLSISSPSATPSIPADVIVDIARPEDLLALIQDLSFSEGHDGLEFLQDVYLALNDPDSVVHSYIFIFSSSPDTYPDGHGISYGSTRLKRVIQNGPYCQTTQKRKAQTSQTYRLLQSLDGGACAFMAAFRSMFITLGLMPPSGYVVSEAGNRINKKLGEKILQDSGFKGPSAPGAGIGPSQLAPLYTSYTADPNFRVECDQKENGKTHYTLNQVSKPPEDTLENQCKELKRKLSAGYDCQLFYSWIKKGGHTERLTSANYSNGCCELGAEDGYYDQGNSSDMPLRGATNSAKACANNNTSSLDKERGPLKALLARCCRKVRK
jgi:hypothetical protein